MERRFMSFQELQRARNQAALNPTPMGPPDKPPQKPAPAKEPKRRGYTANEKAVIVAECDTKKVDAVALEYGVSSSLIYRWRALLKRKRPGRRPTRVTAVKLPAIGEQPRQTKGLVSARAALKRAQTELNLALEQLDSMQEAFTNVFGSGR
jgi:transposase-like protein